MRLKAFECDLKDHVFTNWHQGSRTAKRVKRCIKCNRIYDNVDLRLMYPEQFETRNNLPVKKFEKDNCYLESRFLI